MYTDVVHFLAWQEQKEMKKFMGWDMEIVEPDVYWQAMTKDCRRRVFAIEKDGKVIGQVELRDIVWKTKSAELRIAIGDARHWGQGIGTLTVEWLKEYALSQLHLSHLFLRVYRSNKRAIRCYEKTGFKKKGMLKPSRFSEEPIYLMECIAIPSAVEVG